MSRADHRATRAATTAGRGGRRSLPGAGPSKEADEACSLLAPAATGLEREDGQPATVGPQQFGIDTVLPQPRLNKSGAPCSPRTAAGLARRVQERDQSGVDSQLGTAMQGQPIRNDLKAPVIDGVLGDGEREPEAPKKDDPEKVRGGGELRAGGESGQNTASEGSPLRLQQRQRRGGTGPGRDQGRSGMPLPPTGCVTADKQAVSIIGARLFIFNAHFSGAASLSQNHH